MALDQRPQNPYGAPSTTIEPTQTYLQQLRSMAHRRDVLVRNGFVVKPLSEADIDDKKRCRRCNMRCSNKKNKYKPDARDSKRAHKKLPLGGSGPSSQPRSVAVPAVPTPSGEAPEGAKEDEKPPSQSSSASTTPAASSAWYLTPVPLPFILNLAYMTSTGTAAAPMSPPRAAPGPRST
ncbi:uncharacterized protein ColSpa_06441 [Colletotrichum spaethianum]|uniref:Uncharacterized protein n=1 Tax=Colletotrichum spaethianum TaxID=700344 RepID=A0AA37LGS7_9PEZI|nr:uncharacterized protein ColSpa_06441 [Colletotrichum spaethianum]GKT46260.1 hypothetical protein ColSpa_06441 [Colletotrichum spaethianum]